MSLRQFITRIRERGLEQLFLTSTSSSNNASGDDNDITDSNANTVLVSLQNATIRTTLLSSPILYPSRTHLGKIAEKQITDGFLEFFRRESEHQFQSVPDPKAP